MNIISLFSGAGGLDLGLIQAGNKKLKSSRKKLGSTKEEIHALTTKQNRQQDTKHLHREDVGALMVI